MSESTKGTGLGGVFRELSRLVERLGDLSDNDVDLSRTARFGGEDGETKGVFGLRFRTGVAQDSRARPSAQPFGNDRSAVWTEDRVNDRAGDEVVVEETREPVVDVYDEGDHVLIVAEMPGVEAMDVALEVHDDVITVGAASGSRRFRTEVLLPYAVDPTSQEVTANHGIVHIQLQRQSGG